MLGRQDAALRPPRRPPAAASGRTRASSCSCATGATSALSLRRMPFGPNNAWAAAQWWARGIRAGRRAAERHPDAVRLVRYEDIAARPGRARSARSARSSASRYRPDMLELEKVDRSKIVARPGVLVPDIFAGITTDPVGRWRREMSERDRRIFAALAGDELARPRLRPGPGQRDRHLAAPGALVPAPEPDDAQRELPAAAAGAGARARAAVRAARRRAIRSSAPSAYAQRARYAGKKPSQSTSAAPLNAR